MNADTPRIPTEPATGPSPGPSTEPATGHDTDTAAAAPAGELRGLLLGLRSAWLRLGAASLVINLLLLLPSLYMLQVFDRVMVSQNAWTLVAVSLVTIAGLGAMALAEGWRSRWQVRTSLGLEQRLSGRLFRASALTGLNPLTAQGVQPLSDLTTLRQFLTGPGVHALFDTPWTPIYLVVLWLLHPQLALLAGVFLLLQLVIAAWSQQRSAEPTAVVNAATRNEQLLLRGAARHLEVVEAHGMVPALRRHWLQRREQQRSVSGWLQGLTQRQAALSRFVRQVQQSASLAMGAWLVIQGEISPGAMIAANLLMTRALAPVDALVGVWKSALGARQAYERIERLLAEQPQGAAGLVLEAEPLGRLSFDGVLASVPGRAAALLEDIHLAFEPGSVTALIGPSGAGKSTLARMAVGLWPPTQGQVTLDGQPLQAHERDALGRHIGYLPQDIELLEGTVADNIARFTRADPAQVIAAAQATGLHELILRLPRGYDTPVGEGGHLLSGGMRQRIALARAVYGAPRLIVLDEPNANLDEAGEAALARLLRSLRAQGCTVLVVSHRPALLSAVERVVVLNAGRVLRDGPRDAVLASLRPTAVTPMHSPDAPAAPAAPGQAPLPRPT